MKPLNFGSERPKIGVLAGIGAVVLILGYALFAALPYLLGPSLTIEAAISTQGMATITGTTKRVSFLEINGMPVSLEENGNFLIERAYPTGYTALQAVARDRFGRTITKTITFTSTATYGEKENRESTTTGTIIR
jgi:hypothetical protein